MKNITILLLLALMSCNKSTTQPTTPPQTNNITPIDTTSKGNINMIVYQKCSGFNQQILSNAITKLYKDYNDKVADKAAYSLISDNTGHITLNDVNILQYHAITTGTVNYGNCNNIIIQFYHYITVNKNKTTTGNIVLQ
jgi:hypothetical protein